MSKIAFVPVLALAATIVTFSIPSIAMADTVTKTMRVQTSDLDLSTEAGARQFDRRVQRAAREVCGLSEIRTGSRITSSDAQDCYDNAVRTARVQFASAATRQGA